MLVTQNANIATDQIIKGDWELIGEIDVPSHTSPNTPVELDLGMYESAQPEPMLVLDLEPGITTTTPSPVSVPTKRWLGNDTYILTYLFNNLSGSTYHVRVWQGWA